ncbi:MAG: hypothetical protein ACRCYU_02000, partial [Nocardioides sp.]
RLDRHLLGPVQPADLRPVLHTDHPPQDHRGLVFTRRSGVSFHPTLTTLVPVEQLVEDPSTTQKLDSGGTVTALTTRDGLRLFKSERKWYGYYVSFTRTETQLLAMGFGSCAKFMSKIPVIGGTLSGACFAIAAYAQYLVTVGKCMAIRVLWNGQVIPGSRGC